ncbi:hypothetical protein [Amycolatopsis sp. NPDC059657]
MTWIGALLGMALLVAMALGTFVVDLDDAFGDRRRKAADVREASPPVG